MSHLIEKVLKRLQKRRWVDGLQQNITETRMEKGQVLSVDRWRFAGSIYHVASLLLSASI